ncbi:MAG: hypothetical protein AAF517_16065, partial [Planctomycetota bacterium]
MHENAGGDGPLEETSDSENPGGGTETPTAPTPQEAHAPDAAREAWKSALSALEARGSRISTVRLISFFTALIAIFAAPSSPIYLWGVFFPAALTFAIAYVKHFAVLDQKSALERRLLLQDEENERKQDRRRSR